MTAAGPGTVVVGVDGGARSDDALAVGRRLAVLWDADLVAVSAHPDLVGGDRTAAEAALHRARTRLHGTEARCVAVPGASPAQALHDVASTGRPSMIVIGASAHGPLAARGATRATLHHAPCTVVVAAPGAASIDLPLSRVGVAFDGSAQAFAALNLAADLAAAPARTVSEVDLIYVDAVEGRYELGTSRRDEVATVLRAGAQRLPDRVRSEPVHLYGDPVDELADFGRTLDLLVLGSHDRGLLGRLLLGSVSGGVVARAACTTAVVPAVSRAASVAAPASAQSSEH